MRTVRTGLIVVAVAGVVIAGAAVIGIMARESSAGPECSVTVPGDNGSAVFKLGPEEMGNAATIAAVGTKLGLPAHAATVALATALQESKLRNLAGGDRDSIGLFQQRPSQGWGTPEQLADPVFAATAFYQRLAQRPDWAQLSVNEAAQRVQRSGAPDAYAQWEPEARALAAALNGQFPAALTCRKLGTLKPGKDVAAAAKSELGTATVSGSQPDARGWALASWLVGHAAGFGVEEVDYAGRAWKADSGAWSTASGGGDVLSFRLAAAPPTGGS